MQSSNADAANTKPLPLRYWENVERKEEAVDVNQENDKNLTDS